MGICTVEVPKAVREEGKVVVIGSEPDNFRMFSHIALSKVNNVILLGMTPGSRVGYARRIRYKPPHDIILKVLGGKLGDGIDNLNKRGELLY